MHETFVAKVAQLSVEDKNTSNIFIIMCASAILKDKNIANNIITILDKLNILILKCCNFTVM